MIRNFYSWPHTHPIRGATLNLFQKTWVLGSGNWVRPRSAKSLSVDAVDVDSEDYLPHFGRWKRGRRFIADGPMPLASDIDRSAVVVSTRNRSPSPSLARHRFATDQGRLDSRERFLRRWQVGRCRTIRNGSIAVAGTQVESTPSVSREVPLSQVKCAVLFGARRRAER